MDGVVGKTTLADGAQEAVACYKGASCTRLISQGWAQFEPKQNLNIAFQPGIPISN